MVNHRISSRAGAMASISRDESKRTQHIVLPSQSDQRASQTTATQLPWPIHVAVSEHLSSITEPMSIIIFSCFHSDTSTMPVLSDCTTVGCGMLQGGMARSQKAGRCSRRVACEDEVHALQVHFTLVTKQSAEQHVTPSNSRNVHETKTAIEVRRTKLTHSSS